ncbi:MAG TPA: lysozyme inhibitor LprI family protein [Xanthobacteraceae bacterium]
MPRFIGLALAAAILFAPCSAWAEDQPAENCGDLDTGAAQKKCADITYRAAANELDDVYGRILKAATRADAQHAPDVGAKSWSAALTESQRAWEAYRDAECRGVVGRGGGSGRMVWVLGCLAEKTNARIRELKVPYDER